MLLQRLATGATGVKQARYRQGPTRAARHSYAHAQYTLHGGQNLKLWLLQIMNAIAHLESIPDSLNLAVITPVYKGSGKDPLDRGSYRGISVTPIIAKLLELLILARLQTHLQELGFPLQINLDIVNRLRVLMLSLAQQN